GLGPTRPRTRMTVFGEGAAQATRVARLRHALEAVPDAPAGSLLQRGGPPQQRRARLLRFRAPPPFLSPPLAVPFPLLSGFPFLLRLPLDKFAAVGSISLTVLGAALLE